MDAITTPEAVLLLAIDDRKGTPVLDGTSLAQALGGAGLAELVLRGRLRIVDEREANGARPGTFAVDAAVVEPRLEALVEHAVGRTPRQAIDRLVGWGGAGSPAQVLRTELLGALVADGALVHDERRWLGVTWWEHWLRGPSRDLEDAVQARVRALLRGEEPTEADARLVTAIEILHGAKALPKVLPDLDARGLDDAVAALTRGSWAGEAVRRAISDMQTAMLAATVIVPIATSGSS